MAQRRTRGRQEEQQQDAASMMTQAVRRPKRSKGPSIPPVAATSANVQRAQRDAAVRRPSCAELAAGPAEAGAAASGAPAAKRLKRGTTIAVAAAAAAESAGAASAAQPAPPGGPHHDRRPHAVPPADHHAERKAAEQAPAPAAATAAAARPSRSRRTRRGSLDSDSDASPPRRPAPAPQASGSSESGGGSGRESSAAPGAQATIFAPAFSLHGGKSAAELPGGGPRDATPPRLPPQAAGGGTPTRQRRAAAAAATAAAGSGRRPPVCSPSRPGARSKVDAVEAPASDDENANSEHDTQIRLSSGPGAQTDTLASASDADSSQARATPDTLALVCAGEAVSPESSDDDDAHHAALQGSGQQHQQPPSSGGRPLQALPDVASPQGAEAVDEEYDEDEFMDFDPYLFIRKLPPLNTVVTPIRDVLLPRQTRASKRKTLVLDLDETLVHSSLDGTGQPHFTFPVVFGGREHHVSVRRRPHLATFLERVAALFEVVVFTASQKVYAEQLLNMLDPERRLIRHRIFRDSCVYVEGNYLKDLSVLGRDLAATIIIDNSPQAFGYQLANGIPIESWYDDEADDELLAVLPFLESLVEAPDVRPLIGDAFKLRERVARAPSPEPGRGFAGGCF